MLTAYSSNTARFACATASRVGGDARVVGRGLAGDHDDHVGVDRLGVEDRLDLGGAVGVGVEQVDPQAEHPGLARPAATADELQPLARVQQPGRQDLGADRPPDRSGRTDHRDVHALDVRPAEARWPDQEQDVSIAAARDSRRSPVRRIRSVNRRFPTGFDPDTTDCAANLRPARPAGALSRLRACGHSENGARAASPRPAAVVYGRSAGGRRHTEVRRVRASNPRLDRARRRLPGPRARRLPRDLPAVRRRSAKDSPEWPPYSTAHDIWVARGRPTAPPTQTR